MAQELNQLNLTVVALVALVAIVGLVALVMNAVSIPKLATGSRVVSATPLNAADADKPTGMQNSVGQMMTEGEVCAMANGANMNNLGSWFKAHCSIVIE